MAKKFLDSTPTEKTPASILKEQGKHLSEQTKNQLVVTVKPYTVNIEIYKSLFDQIFDVQTKDAKINKKLGLPNMALVHDFIVSAPTLGNYQFVLLKIQHSMSDSYPLNVENCINPNNQKVRNEKEYEEALKNVFTDAMTIKVINTLLSQILVEA